MAGTAERQQLHFVSTSFDELIPPEHRVRKIWRWLEEFDLEPFYARVLARGSSPGRAATDPRILLGLWVFATSEGIGSARRLARLCERRVSQDRMRVRAQAGAASFRKERLPKARAATTKGKDASTTRVSTTAPEARGINSLPALGRERART